MVTRMDIAISALSITVAIIGLVEIPILHLRGISFLAERLLVEFEHAGAHTSPSSLPLQQRPRAPPVTRPQRGQG